MTRPIKYIRTLAPVNEYWSYEARLKKLKEIRTKQWSQFCENCQMWYHNSASSCTACRTEKNCSICKTVKPLIFFAHRKKSADGHAFTCIPCRRDYKRFLSYGISLEMVEHFLTKQDNVCAICRDTLGQDMHVDHNHDTGKVRGLLCRGCNTGIGMLKEDVVLLQQAINYLKEVS